MSDLPPKGTSLDTPNPSPAANEARHAQIRAEAVSLVIGGLVCIFFGFFLGARAPGNATPEETERWYRADNISFYCLRGVGVVFLIAAAVAAMGNRAALLISMTAEVLFVALMIVMIVIWSWRAQVHGAFDPLILLLVIAGITVAINAHRAWKLHRAIATGRPDPTE